MSNPGFGPQPPDVALDEDDWFGEGSAFDSGEDLAAALMAFAGVTDPGVAPAEAQVPAFDVTSYTPVSSTPRVSPRSSEVAEFQIAELPATSGAVAVPVGAGARGWSSRPSGERNGWAIRNSVKMLKTTEDVMRRLREDAVEVTWRAAAVALTHTGR